MKNGFVIIWSHYELFDWFKRKFHTYVCLNRIILPYHFEVPSMREIQNAYNVEIGGLEDNFIEHYKVDTSLYWFRFDHMDESDVAWIFIEAQQKGFLRKTKFLTFS